MDNTKHSNFDWMAENGNCIGSVNELDISDLKTQSRGIFCRHESSVKERSGELGLAILLEARGSQRKKNY